MESNNKNQLINSFTSNPRIMNPTIIMNADYSPTSQNSSSFQSTIAYTPDYSLHSSTPNTPVNNHLNNLCNHINKNNTNNTNINTNNNPRYLQNPNSFYLPISNNSNNLLDTPNTPNTPYSMYNSYSPHQNLENDLLISNNSTNNVNFPDTNTNFNFNVNNTNNSFNANKIDNYTTNYIRTPSLTTPLKLSGIPNNTPSSSCSIKSTNLSLISDSHPSLNINRFSIPAVTDNDPNNYSLERQLNNLSFDINNNKNNLPTRRNTLFSNASVSSTATSNSIISANSTNQLSNNSAKNSLRSANSNILGANQFSSNLDLNSKSTSTPPPPPSSSSSSLSLSNTILNANTNTDVNVKATLNTNVTTISSKSSNNNFNNNVNSLALIPIDLSALSSTEIILLSKDQNGCRMLQKLIDDDHSKNLPIVFNATYKNSSKLMLDPFGNYLIQKLMISATASQISLIIIDITPNIEQIAINLHGTRALQKLIGCLTTSNHHDLIALAISPVIVNLIHDLNGNHVIQRLIAHFFANDLDFLINLIIIHLIEIATHKHGCCVLQKLLNKCSNFQIQKVSNEILKNSVYLMKDQFGNYVIQYLISLNIDSINYQLLKLVADELVPLSYGKFSSNVVEKCLKLNPSGCSLNGNIHPLLASMINVQTLMSLIKDQYGNYVVQTALEIADWPIKCVMAEMIKPLLPNIRYSNYGKRIHSKVITILSEMESNNELINLQKDFIDSPNTPSNLLPGINFLTHN
jgi:hypothetical protein